MRNPQKPLTDSEVRALVPGSKRVVYTLGNSLFLTVESVAKGSSKRFVGCYRQPPGQREAEGICDRRLRQEGWAVLSENSEGGVGEGACLGVGDRAGLICNGLEQKRP